MTKRGRRTSQTGGVTITKYQERWRHHPEDIFSPPKKVLSVSLFLSPTCYIIPLYFMISSSFLSSFRVSHLRFDCQTVIYQSTGGRALTCFSSFLYHTSSKKKNFSRLAKKKCSKFLYQLYNRSSCRQGGKI